MARFVVVALFFRTRNELVDFSECDGEDVVMVRMYLVFQLLFFNEISTTLSIEYSGRLLRSSFRKWY